MNIFMLYTLDSVILSKHLSYKKHTTIDILLYIDCFHACVVEHAHLIALYRKL